MKLFDTIRHHEQKFRGRIVAETCGLRTGNNVEFDAPEPEWFALTETTSNADEIAVGGANCAGTRGNSNRPITAPTAATSCLADADRILIRSDCTPRLIAGIAVGAISDDRPYRDT